MDKGPLSELRRSRFFHVATFKTELFKDILIPQVGMTSLELLPRLCYTEKNREKAGDSMGLIHMVRETLQITKQGWYEKAGRRIPLVGAPLGVTSDNLGYTQGIMWDGTPFEAELWTGGMDVILAVVMPETKVSQEFLPHEPLVCGNVAGFHNTVSCADGSVLRIGMVDRGEDVRVETIQGYVKKLVDAGLVRFTTAARNGSVRYVTDENGTDLVQVIVALTVDGERLAFT